MKKIMLMLTLLALIVISACATPSYAGYEYGDFEVIREWEALENVGQDEYEMVYLYDMDFLGRDTQGSAVINPDLFTFAKENPDAPKMWRINTREISGERPLDFQTRAPKILWYRDGEYQDRYFGGTPILEMIEGFEDGRFHFPEHRGRLEPLEKSFDGQAYEDHPRLDRWQHMHDIGHDAVDIVFAYERDMDGLSQESDALMGDALSLKTYLEDDGDVYTANIHETIGLYAHDMDRVEAPAIYIVYNNVIQESFYGEASVSSFIRDAPTIDFDAYKE